MDWPSVASLAPWPATSMSAISSWMIVAYFCTTTRAGSWVVVAAIRSCVRFSSAVRAVAASCWVCAENEALIWLSSCRTTAEV
jgi:hypothetical protein